MFAIACGMPHVVVDVGYYVCFSFASQPICVYYIFIALYICILLHLQMLGAANPSCYNRKPSSHKLSLSLSFIFIQFTCFTYIFFLISQQLFCSLLALFLSNLTGIYTHWPKEKAQRKAFIETRQCIEARLRTQRENQQQVSDFIIHYCTNVWMEASVCVCFKFAEVSCHFDFTHIHHLSTWIQSTRRPVDFENVSGRECVTLNLLPARVNSYNTYICVVLYIKLATEAFSGISATVFVWFFDIILRQMERATFVLSGLRRADGLLLDSLDFFARYTFIHSGGLLFLADGRRRVEKHFFHNFGCWSTEDSRPRDSTLYNTVLLNCV